MVSKAALAATVALLMPFTAAMAQSSSGDTAPPTGPRTVPEASQSGPGSSTSREADQSIPSKTDPLGGINIASAMQPGGMSSFRTGLPEQQRLELTKRCDYIVDNPSDYSQNIQNFCTQFNAGGR
jgi:hypothetical protein